MIFIAKMPITAKPRMASSVKKRSVSACMDFPPVL
jgi:hypothetical protein